MNFTIATTVNYTYIELTKNWLANLKKFNINNIIVFCLDKQSFDALKDITHCILQDTLSTLIQTRAEWIEAEKYFKYLAPLNYVKQNKCDILFSDVDVVFLKNPVDCIINNSRDVDIVVMNDKRYDPFHRERKRGRIITINSNTIKDWGISDQEKFGELNGSVAYYKYSEKLVEYFESVFNKRKLEQYPVGVEDGAAQTIFNDFINTYKADIKIKVLSVFDFANGSLLNVSYLKRKVLENACGIHYNFCENMDPIPSCVEKINRIKEDGFWYI